jgi:DNA-binding LacI/PurR family transcriptional regulator
LINEIQAGRVHGIISIGLDSEIADWIDAQPVAHVAFTGPACYTVSLDSEKLVRLATTQLVQQSCRKIAFWQSAAPLRPLMLTPTSTLQSVAFRKSLEQSGLKFQTDRVRYGLDEKSVHNARNTESAQEQGYRIAQEVFAAAADSWPDGVVINEDMMTHGALVALANLGVRVGQDVKIATHANCGSTVLLGHEEKLTRVEVNPAEVVHAIFGLLETLLQGITPAHNDVVISPKVRA